MFNLCQTNKILANILLTSVSVVISIKLLYFLLKEFYIHVIGALTLKQRLRGYGKWAVVTGCNRGLGVEFCRQLAALGINLVMVARNERVVREEAKQLEDNHGIKTYCIIADFDSAREEDFDKVVAELKDKDIGIFVNNAGVMYDSPDFMHVVESQMLKRIVNVNIMWPLRLCHYFVQKKMAEGGKGLVVSVSSTAGRQFVPLLAAYGASKAFVYYMSKCLSVEYAGTGVDFQVLTPSYVATDMTKYSSVLNTPSINSPSGRNYVRNALHTFGMTSDTTGYFPHALMLLLTSLLPDWLWCSVVKHWQLLLKSAIKTPGASEKS